MNRTFIRSVAFFLSLFTVSSITAAQPAEKIQIATPPSAHPCLAYAAQKMRDALSVADYTVEIVTSAELTPRPNTILIGTKDDGPAFANAIQPLANKKEAYVIQCKPGKSILIAGSDPAGALYGTWDIGTKLWEQKGQFPDSLERSESPVFAIRATRLPLQKPCLPSDAIQCDSSITKENIPWIFEKNNWETSLDLFVMYRINMVILDNSHPFSSLLDLPAFPNAKQGSPDQLKKNADLYQWLVEQADRRGITLVQSFSAPVPASLASKNELHTNWDNPTPNAKEYLQSAVKEFIAKYPKVGLLPDLGSLQNEETASDWLCKIILPAVKEGLKTRNTDSQPPLLISSSLINVQKIVPQTLALYNNLCTLTDRSNQVLISEQIQGKARARQQEFAKLGAVSIAAVNTPVNLAPFRYGDTSFICNSVNDVREIGFNGILVSPLHYWDWPYSNGRGNNRRIQIYRDWIWFDAWSRYAWNPQREPAEDKQYWVNRLNEKFQNQTASEQILEAYENAGRCIPLISRSFGLTDSSRQTLTLGMTMPQLLYPERFGLQPEFWLAYAPVAERMQDYFQRESKKLPHEGQTPPQAIQDIRTYAKNALDAIEKARPYADKNQAEYRQIRMDILATYLISEFYTHRAEAALQLLQYSADGNIETLKTALNRVDRSMTFIDKTAFSLVDYYSQPLLLPEYQEIPFPVKNTAYKNWDDCYTAYEEEFNTFQWQVNSLLQGAPAPGEKKDLPSLASLDFQLLTQDAELYEIKPGAKLFTDRAETIETIASELAGLKGIRFSDKQARQKETKIEIDLPQPAKILVAYFAENPEEYSQFYHLRINENYPPQDRNENMVIRYALQSSGLPPVHVWAYPLEAGKQTLSMKQGSFLILGVVPTAEKITHRTVFTPAKDLTWLFE